MLVPRSRRPNSSPSRIKDEVKQQALDVRAALERSGLDHGPISVHDKMVAMGLDAPSVASLARIFRESGVARNNPSKKPRAAYHRFTYPAPNACWQLDATQYALSGGRVCVIFQLQDDNSRSAVASHVAPRETSEAAITVFKKGVAARGVPQRLLTDNGLALNPSRRGIQGELVTYVTSLGVEAITGKPYKPTTQGKNERFHQTLLQWLNKQPLADSIEELQALVDQFDQIYNHERPHQGLPGRMTPQQAWDATPVAEPPRPQPAPLEAVTPLSREKTLNPDPPVEQRAPKTRHRMGSHGERTVTIATDGKVKLRSIGFQINKSLAGVLIRAIWDTEGIIFTHLNGEVIIEHPWPPTGTKYVPNGRRPGRPPKQR